MWVKGMEALLRRHIRQGGKRDELGLSRAEIEAFRVRAKWHIRNLTVALQARK